MTDVFLGDSGESRDGDGDPAEIEITTEMIAAGVDAFLSLDREGDAWERIVTDVYQAMEMARRSPIASTSSGHQSAQSIPWWRI